MKKYFAIFAIGTGRSLHKILIGALILVAIETIMFLGLGDIHSSEFHESIRRSHIELVFAITSCVFTIIALRTRSKKINSKYIYEMMNVSKEKSFIVTSLAGTIVYIFYWLLQIAVICGFYVLYMKANDYHIEDSNGIYLFTAVHEVPFLIPMFPLDRVTMWGKALFTAVCFGIGCASFEYDKGRVMGASLLAVTIRQGIFGGYPSENQTASILMFVMVLLMIFILIVVLEPFGKSSNEITGIEEEDQK
ncbi:MAG: hypothetical protein IIU36_05320 [Firmicutes bacterium]|nr:hypothetical protein [Bacillota bacterium]